MKQDTKNLTKGKVRLNDLEQEIKALDNAPPKSVKKPKKKKPSKAITTLFHKVKDKLRVYDLRFDEIKLEIEISEKGKNEFKKLNDSNLYVEIREKDVKISKSDLREILKSDFVEKFDPINKYFENLEPYNDGEPDFIEELANYVKVENQIEFDKHFKKHLVRCIRCALDDSFFNKQAFILVHSTHNSGKTTFCRFLCPPALKDYFAEDISTDKDGLILLATNFLINLDELSTLQKAEINALKSYFSKTSINVRLPYDAKNSNITRKCSFIGSTNLAQFLTDETGSVRWLCFQIKSIDFKYSSAVDIDNVWRQAYHLYKSGFELELTPDEIKQNELRNAQFQIISVEEELITKYFEIPNADNYGKKEFLQATEITAYLNSVSPSSKINHIQIGKILTKYFERDRKSVSKLQKFGYWVVKSQTY
ncbi:MAG: virulence-associated E family protein [Arcicella sp.]|jgi:predicted P-loop ATPase|nr:virulence-associated E family protein [Arcicella sp.]